MDLALLLSSLGLGLRHGVDWDHVSAITDITGTEYAKRRAAWLAVLYALGHGAAVMTLGAIAIVLGDRLPSSADAVMERVVGATLIVLAIVLARSAFRGRTTSRGLLLLNGLRRVRARLRRTNRVEIEHAHPEAHARVVTTHVHTVDVTRYTVAGAVTVGVLHGVGAETGTQALALVSASRIASTAAAVGVLAAFVTGIVVTTGVMAMTTAFGWHTLSARGRAYKIVTLATAAGSAALGMMYLW